MRIVEEISKQLSFYNSITNKIFLKTYFDEQYQTQYITWYDFVPIEQLISAYIELGRYLKKNKYVALQGLVDLTYMEGSFEEHNDWMVKEYLPKSIQYGYHRTAFVKSNDYFSNLALEFFAEENNKHLKGHEMRLFDTVKEAEDWLKS